MCVCVCVDVVENRQSNQKRWFFTFQCVAWQHFSWADREYIHKRLVFIVYCRKNVSIQQLQHWRLSKWDISFNIHFRILETIIEFAMRYYQEYKQVYCLHIGNTYSGFPSLLPLCLIICDQIQKSLLKIAECSEAEWIEWNTTFRMNWVRRKVLRCTEDNKTDWIFIGNYIATYNYLA